MTPAATRVWTFTYTTTSGVKQLTSIDGPRTLERLRSATIVITKLDGGEVGGGLS